MQRVVKRQSRIDVCFLLKILYESEGITFMSCDDSLLHPVLLVRVCVSVCTARGGRHGVVDHLLANGLTLFSSLFLFGCFVLLIRVFCLPFFF